MCRTTRSSMKKYYTMIWFQYVFTFHQICVLNGENLPISTHAIYSGKRSSPSSSSANSSSAGWPPRLAAVLGRSTWGPRGSEYVTSAKGTTLFTYWIFFMALLIWHNDSKCATLCQGQYQKVEASNWSNIDNFFAVTSDFYSDWTFTLVI